MAKQQIEIIHEDEDLIVVNKPPGVLSIPDRHQPGKINLQHYLTEHYGRIWVVHRLDRETSGILCFARNAAAHRHLSLQFEGRTIGKTYQALVDGLPAAPEGKIDKPIGPHPSQPGKMTILRHGKPALSRYRVVETFRQFAFLEVDLLTGRTHQIRVHLASIGHPLVIDPLYGKREAFFLSEVKGSAYRLRKGKEERPLMTRLTLHAGQLSLNHPAHDKRRAFSAPLPKDFAAVIKQLRKWGK
jgi:23S rRNA pseudouridine1911/1915/1917 synthase